MNIIRGTNSHGKSTIANFIFYVLGGDVSRWTPEAETCDFVFAEVSANGATLTLKREVTTKAAQPLYIFYGPYATAAQSAVNGWLSFSYRRSDQGESFSQALFRALQMPEVQGEGSSNITMHQLLRLVYVDQMTPVDQLMRWEEFDPALIRQTVFNYLLGLFDNTLYDDQLTLREARKLYELTKAQLRNLERVLDKAEFITDAKKLADQRRDVEITLAGLLIKELKARGLAKRILIVAPANLTFQWQREMKDKFREQFTVVRSDLLRANYGTNPWQDYDQIVTSVSWVSRIEDARDSLLRSRWDLVIVDEAHKMSAYSAEKETLAYKLGKALSDMTDHYLLMTATPHKGDPENFALFLQLLDRDVYADVSSLEQAMVNREAPFYLRRVKEALVSFPHPDTGEVKSLFTKRIVKTAKFEIADDELDFYDALTRFVQDQSIRAAADGNSPAARAVGFTMAMLQRRFASSLYAARRTLERMKERREKIIADPAGYRQDQINRRVPEGFDDLEEEEQQAIIAQLEEVVLNPDPESLKEEVRELTKLIDQARALEARAIETKLTALKALLTENGVFADPKMKLLIFTEHKDTLDYLTGDGREGRPVGKLRDWGLSLTTIHGGMKIGDRNTPGSRIFAEREFKESCQVMVATEAAGEGINLQFCWLMVNYDIPWNPMRLEQRMGRIHRYGQEKDCLIFNFVATNTAEGRVLQKLFDRIEQIEDDLDPGRTGKIFNVLGEVFPSNLLERMLRDMYARNQTEQVILDRIVKDVDTRRFSEITNSTLEGLAKKELNLSAVIGKTAEAKERRLVPEVIEDFFVEASQDVGLKLTNNRNRAHIYRVGRPEW